MQGQTLDPTDVGSGTVAAFLALHSVVCATVDRMDIGPTLCNNAPFHWNGTEIVVCTIGERQWPEVSAQPVHVSLLANTLRFEFEGVGSTDQVRGVAPEYREQLVTYLGAAQGNAVADQAGATAVTHRLFITPIWGSRAA